MRAKFTEDGDPLLTPSEAATYLKCCTSTLANYRRKNIGPPYLKFGYKCVRYRFSDLEHYVKTFWRKNNETE